MKKANIRFLTALAAWLMVLAWAVSAGAGGAIVGSPLTIVALTEGDAAAAREMMQAYERVLSGRQSYIQSGWEDEPAREAVMPGEIYSWYGFDFDRPLGFTAFCVTDLDADGYPEVILKLSEDFGFELLRFEAGVVYGFPFVSRAMIDITLEGDIFGSSGVFDSSWYKLRFSAGRMEETEVCAMRSDDSGVRYFIGDREVPRSEYDAFESALYAKQKPVWYEYTKDNFAAIVSQF